jgi:hypothetical protein
VQLLKERRERRSARLLAAACAVLASLGAPASAEGYLDATIEVANTQAPDGGTFHVTGRSSCTLTDVTLKYRRYDGEVDIATEQAKTKDRPDGRVDYTIDFIVPFNAQPGPGRLFADARCGDPNAAPSREVDVTIVKAAMTLRVDPLRAAPGSTLTVTGDRCYGDGDGRVTIRASGVLTAGRVATLTQQRFVATFRVPDAGAGSVSFSVAAPDCSGSSAGSARAVIVAVPSSSPTVTRSTAPLPRPTTTVPSAVSSRSPASPSPTPNATTPPPTASGSGSRRSVVWPAFGLLALVTAGGSLALRFVRSRG